MTRVRGILAKPECMGRCISYSALWVLLFFSLDICVNWYLACVSQGTESGQNQAKFLASWVKMAGEDHLVT